MSESQASNLNGSKALVINPYSNNPVRLNEKAKSRAAAIEARRLGTPVVTKVDRVSSVTVEVDAIVMGSHSFVSGATTTQYVALLIIDPTSVYNGDEPIFQPPSNVKINKAKKTLAIPLASSKYMDATRAEWAAMGVDVPPCPSHHILTDCCQFVAKIATPTPVDTPLHSGFRVQLSSFGYLLGANDEKRPANSSPPKSIGVTMRAHVMQQTTEPNSPLLFKIFIENPQLMKLPVPSFDEIRLLDTEVKNTSKSADKQTMIGSTLIWIPMLCGVKELECHISALEKGTSSAVGFPSPAVFTYQKKDGVTVQVCDIILSLIQWNGDTMYDDLVLFRLWTESLQLFGVTAQGPWGMGLGEAMIKQTPTIYNGYVNHTDSEAYQRANTNEAIRSIISLNALQPIMDVPWAIMNIYGIPVTKQFAQHMSVLTKRLGPKPEAHPMFTVASPSSYKENTYNTSAEPMMLVLNELDPNARPSVFKDEENLDWAYFAVVGNKIMMDADKELLQQLRDLQNDKTYAGALGEMLTFKNWNCNDVTKWKTVIYGVSCNEEYTKVSPQHPVLVNKATAMATNDFFYIFAISRTRYNAAMTKKSAPKTQKRLREITHDEASTADTGAAQDENTAKISRTEE